MTHHSPHLPYPLLHVAGLPALTGGNATGLRHALLNA